MWPVEGNTAAAAGGSIPNRPPWPAILAGGIGVVLAVGAFSLLAIRAGAPSAAVYGVAGVGPARLWASEGSGFRALAASNTGPRSNHADMAFDIGRGLLVVWDHGCAHLVMGFQGGCTEQLDQTWTWDGRTWSAHSPRSEPVQTGRGGAMAYDSRLGEVVYANDAGQAWAWSGEDWRRLVPAAPAGATRAGTVAVGWEADNDRLLLVAPDSTWAWDGVRWSRAGGGIDPTDARPDAAQLVDDSQHGQLIYVGKGSTWTWSGAGWQKHPQPTFASAATVFDPALGAVALIAEDTEACDRVACQSTTWAWSGSTWTELPGSGPALPLSRSGAFPPALAYDPSRRELDVLVSAS